MNLLRRWLKSKAVQALVLGLCSGLLVVAADRAGWLDALERKSLDWRFRTFTEPGRASRDIVIIALDDSSFSSEDMIENFGRWPWRRKLYAGLVHYLNEGGAVTTTRTHGCYPLWCQWLTSILGPISGKYVWKPQN